MIATGTVRSDVPVALADSPSCLAPGVEGRPILHGEGPGEVSVDMPPFRSKREGDERE